MTEEERKEAERLAERVMNPVARDADPILFGWLCEMYLAGRESLRASVQDHLDDMRRIQDAERALEVERERSAKLIERIKMIADEIDLSEWQKNHGSPSIGFYQASVLITKAIAEYEASR